MRKSADFCDEAGDRLADGDRTEAVAIHLREALVAALQEIAEYRQHRALDGDLPTTYREWLSSLDRHLQQKAGQVHKRIVTVVIHPGEIETWARHEGREVNE